EQRERAHRGLELVADVGDEVPPDLFHPPALRLVLGKQQDEAVVAERGDPDGEAGPPAAERAPGKIDLALAGLSVPPDLPDQREQLPDHQLAIFDEAERAGRLAGHQHRVGRVEHDRRGGEHGQHGRHARWKPGGARPFRRGLKISDAPAGGHQPALAVAGRDASARLPAPAVTCTLTFRWYAENARGALDRLSPLIVFLRYS